nr:winged helix-turn-helix domain-containing protein [Ligilactobacillus salivarius]
MTSKEVRREVRDYSDVISEEQVDKIRKSKKTGKKYHPFIYRFNLAVKHLITAGYIVTENNHDLELSEKERTVDFEKFDPIHDVRSIVDGPLNDEVDDSNPSEDNDETWRTELLDALAKMLPISS